MKNFSGATFTLVGRPGCGKGTQTKLLASYLRRQGHKKIIAFSVGKLFRRLEEKPTVLGRWTKEFLDKGKLAPEWMALALWFDEIKDKLVDKRQIVIIDGSPRRLVEAKALDHLMRELGRKPMIPIHLNISEQVAKNRVKSRGRKDYKVTSAATRMKWFRTEVVPVIKYYGRRMIEVDGEGSIEEVRQRILNSLNKK
jgi:adenylate kinase